MERGGIWILTHSVKHSESAVSHPFSVRPCYFPVEPARSCRSVALPYDVYMSLIMTSGISSQFLLSYYAKGSPLRVQRVEK